MTLDTKNGWGEWKNLVLDKLETSQAAIKKLEDKVDNNKEDVVNKIAELKTDIAMIKTEMKTRASFTGAISGGIISILIMIVGAIILSTMGI